MQREIAKDTLVEVAYNGNHSLNMPIIANYNQANPNVLSATCNATVTSGCLAEQARVQAEQSRAQAEQARAQAEREAAAIVARAEASAAQADQSRTAPLAPFKRHSATSGVAVV